MKTQIEAKRMEAESTLAMERMGKMKLYEEVFISSYGATSVKEAERILASIQEAHPSSRGWYCPGGEHEGVCVDTDEKFHAYRHHAKYA